MMEVNITPGYLASSFICPECSKETFTVGQTEKVRCYWCREEFKVNSYPEIVIKENEK